MFSAAINAISTKTSIGLSCGIALLPFPGIVQKVARVGAVIGILGWIYNAYNTKPQALARELSAGYQQGAASVASKPQNVKKHDVGFGSAPTVNPSTAIVSEPQNSAESTPKLIGSALDTTAPSPVQSAEGQKPKFQCFIEGPCEQIRLERYYTFDEILEKKSEIKEIRLTIPESEYLKNNIKEFDQITALTTSKENYLDNLHVE